MMTKIEEWKKEKALKLLEEGKVTISKAAKIAKIDIWSMILLIKERGIIWNKNKEFIMSDIKKAF